MARLRLSYVGDSKVRALLEAHACPVPFHGVRARLMGNIASPALDAVPLRAIESLWPGGLPAFEGTNEADRLVQALMGLWNHLAQHQKQSKPFRFARSGKLDSREQMRALAVMRCEEIENFIDGLFGGEEDLDVPEEVAEELDVLGETFGYLSGVRDLLTREASPPHEEELADLSKSLLTLDRTAQEQVNSVILACVAERQEMIARGDIKGSTLN